MTHTINGEQKLSNEILIVDDTLQNLKLLADILKAAGYVVRPASEGKLAIRSALAKPPGIILLDINMPEMDGFEVCQQLKAHEKTASIPIIFISALNDEAAIIKGFKLGSVDYITKPFREEEVIARVKTHLNLQNSYIELAYRNEELAIARNHLEEVVNRRTAELKATNLSLQDEIVERKNAEVKIRRQMDHLSALSEIDRTINTSLDLTHTLDMILRHIIGQLQADAAGIFLLNPTTMFLEPAAVSGFRTDVFKKVKVRIGEDLTGQVASRRQALQISNLNENHNSLVSGLYKGEGFISYFGTPLVAKGQVKGVLEVFQRNVFIPNEEWLDFCAALAGQASIAIDNSLLFTDLQRLNSELTIAYDETIEGWSRALDLRDRETEGHTQRVTNLTLKLAETHGIRGEDIINIRMGALLHDIGKMGIPDEVLLKPGPLSVDEWIIMKKHPIYAYELLSPIHYLQKALDIPFCHHEKWDGTGYPRGLKAEQIPLSARIFMVIDVWDALTSDRPYRAAWSKERTINHILEGAGSHFDPQIVKMFMESKAYEFQKIIESTVAQATGK